MDARQPYIYEIFNETCKSFVKKENIEKDRGREDRKGACNKGFRMPLFQL